MGNQAARSMKLVAICLLLGCAAAASVVEDATNPDDFDPPELLKTLDVKLKGARAAFNAAEGKVEALGLDVARLKAELETIKMMPTRPIKSIRTCRTRRSSGQRPRRTGMWRGIRRGRHTTLTRKC